MLSNSNRMIITALMFLFGMFKTITVYASHSDVYQNYGTMLENISDENLTINENNGSYLSLSLNNQYVIALKQMLEVHLNLSLIDRGEAHITLFSPMEWMQIKPYVTREIMEDFFGDLSKINSKCLGMGKKGGEYTFFLIVDSKYLLQRRQQFLQFIQDKFGVQFNFYPYRPHITIGFTKDDLHYQDGIDKSQCWI